MKLSILAGATSQSINIFIQDSSSTTGAGLTGLAYNTAGLTAYYSFAGASATATAITLATLATVTTAYSSGGFIAIDGTNMPGWYRLDLPNAAIASGNGRSVALHLKGATNMAPLPIEIELTGWDNQDATKGGLSNLDAAISSRMATFTLPTNFSSLAITAGGAVTSGTVSDKTGYSLTQAFPTNFSALGISATGHISNVDTLTTYTGNTPQTGDAFARLGAPAGASVSADVAAVKSDTGTTLTDAAAIKTQTDKFAFTVANQVDANMLSISGSASGAAALNNSTNSICYGTCSGGTTTTAVVSALSNPASLTASGQLIGRTIIFLGSTASGSLQAQASNITASTTGATPTITFTAMTTAPAAGDKFVIL